MATKMHPYRALMSYKTVASVTTYSDFSDLYAVKPPHDSVGVTDVTTLDSTSQTGYKEFIPSWGDGGEAGFSVYLTKAQFTTILALRRITADFQVSFPPVDSESTVSKMTFNGFITSIDINSMETNDDSVRVPITIKVSGKPGFSSGS